MIDQCEVETSPVMVPGPKGTWSEEVSVSLAGSSIEQQPGSLEQSEGSYVSSGRR